MTMTYAKALRELDLFPELGMDSCQASLVFKSSLPLTLLYNRGKLVSATLMLEDSPKDILQRRADEWSPTGDPDQALPHGPRQPSFPQEVFE